MEACFQFVTPTGFHTRNRLSAFPVFRTRKPPNPNWPTLRNSLNHGRNSLSGQMLMYIVPKVQKAGFMTGFPRRTAALRIILESPKTQQDSGFTKETHARQNLADSTSDGTHVGTRSATLCNNPLPDAIMRSRIVRDPGNCFTRKKPHSSRSSRKQAVSAVQKDTKTSSNSQKLN